MSFAVLARVKDVSDAVPSSSAMLLLYVLAEFANDEGEAFPSQALLSRRTRLSVREVRDNLARLIRAGLISVEQRRRKDGSRGSNLVQLRLPEKLAKPSARSGLQPRKGLDSQSTGLVANDRNGQMAPLGQRQGAARPPAPIAGLTTFEPVTQQITLGAGARGPSEAVEPAKGSTRGRLEPVPPLLRSEVAADPRYGEAWVRSWLDPCSFDVEARTLHPRSPLARSRMGQELGRLLANQGIHLGRAVGEAA